MKVYKSWVKFASALGLQQPESVLFDRQIFSPKPEKADIAISSQALISKTHLNGAQGVKTRLTEDIMINP